MSALAHLVSQVAGAPALKPERPKRTRRAPAPGSNLGGRPPVLSEAARALARALLAEGKLTHSEIAEQVGGKRHHIVDIVRRSRRDADT